MQLYASKMRIKMLQLVNSKSNKLRNSQNYNINVQILEWLAKTNALTARV